MYRGRYAMGDFVPLLVQCKNASGVPTFPDDCPNIRVFNPSGTLISNFQIPVLDRYQATALFQFALPLTTMYSTTGNWRVVYSYGIGTYTGLDEDTFEVVEGGESRGNVISMHYMQRPDADNIIWQTDNGNISGIVTDGKVVTGRNPALP